MAIVSSIGASGISSIASGVSTMVNSSCILFALGSSGLIDKRLFAASRASSLFPSAYRASISLAS